METENKYCVYFHINPLKNEIFYVGIGCESRAYSKHNRNRFWNFLVKKYGYIVDVCHKNLTIEQAKKLEIQYIKKIGRRDLGLGKLVNLADGGEGHFGAKDTLETRQRKSQYWIEFYKTNASHNIGKKHSKDINIKKGKSLSANNKAKKITYDGTEYGCQKELYNDKFKDKLSYSHFNLLIKTNKLN